MSAFDLVGHDCPLGRYPAPVVPVGRLQDGTLAVAYWSEAGATLEPLEECASFMEHAAELRERIGAFDPDKEHLFAHSATDVVKYARAAEKEVFLQFLAQEDFARDNPYLRLDLAEATMDPGAVLSEVKRCIAALAEDNPRLRETWYVQRREELARHVPGVELPPTWQEFIGKSRIYHIQTFRPEAPELPALVKGLFCSRDEELARALAVLKENLDVGGEQSTTRDKRPWVLHGDSRSGKSHLARRLMMELPNDAKHIQVALVVRQKLDAALAMQELLDHLLSIHAERSTSPKAPPELALPPLGERSASLLARACGRVVRALIASFGIEHVLILIDDVDLLEDYAARAKSGGLQCATLSSAIAELVKIGGVDVILTARSWYREKHRECEELVELTPMSLDQLMTVYERQLSVFAPLRPCNPLSDEAARKAAERTNGLPGLFLQHMHIALAEYRREPDWRDRDFAWYFGVMERDYKKREFRRPDQARRIAAEVRLGKSTMRVDDPDLFGNMQFNDVYVIQSSWSPDTLDINPLGKDMAIPQRAA